MSLTSSPAPGTTLNASPDVHDRRDRGQVVLAGGVVAAGHRLRGRGEREQRVAPAVGRRARVRGAAVRAHAQRAGGLAAHDDALLPVGRARAALEAEAGVEAGEALGVGELGGPPLLVADQQQGDLGVVLRPRGERPQHAEREHDAALHVDRAGADELVADALERAVRGVRDHGVEVAEQQDAAAALAVEAGDQVVGVVGRRAGDVLELGVVGRERGAHRRALLRPVTVARGRGDGDERLELARRAARDLLRALRDPLVHRPASYPATVYGRCPSCPRWRSSPAV